MQVSTPTPAPIAAPRKKRHVFLWIFLTVQALFIIWIIAGSASHGPDTGTQVAQLCDNHAWYPLYNSQADCVKSGGALLAGASDVGKGLAIGLIVVFWVVVDFLLGVSYGVYKLATRR